MSRRPSVRIVTLALLLALLGAGMPVTMASATPQSDASAGKRVNEVDLFKSPKVKRIEPQGAKSPGKGHRKGDPKKVKEFTDKRTATSATWVNDDGSLTVERYLDPRFFKQGNAWKKIDTRLTRVPNTSDSWQSGANSWKVLFSSPSNPNGTVRFTQPGSTVAFTPRHVASPNLTPKVDGSRASYVDLWDGADLVQDVSTTEVKETILVAGPDAAASYDFDLAGATPRLEKDGSITLHAGGKRLGTIPAASVETADTKAVRGRLAGANPRMQLIDGGIRVSVSEDWLESLPKSAFPVEIDPTYSPGSSHPTTVRAYPSGGGAGTTSEVRLGTNASGTWASAVSVPVPAPPAPLNSQPWKLGFASMVVFCGTACNLTSPQGWNPATTPTSYATVQSGPAVSTAFEPIGDGLYVFAGNTSSWVNGTSPWLGFKATSGTYLQIPTGNIFFSYRYYELPPPSAITAPTTGSTVATTTPTLKTTAPASNLCANISSTGTCDQPGNVYYNFKVSTAPQGEAGQTVAQSGWINGPYSTNGNGDFVVGVPSWTVPAGSLRDGVTYYASVQVTNTLILYASDENSGNILITPDAGTESSFTIKVRLGDGGPSATDSVGSVPGKADSESKGSPSPGVTTPSLTANMITGNVSFALTGVQTQTISSAAGIVMTYNSMQSATSGSAAAGGASYGLRGQYYEDSGSHAFPSSTPVGTRVDPSVDLHGGFGTAPIGGLDVGSPTPGAGYIVRWIGRITLPSTGAVPTGTTFNLGGATTGGMRVILNGSTVYDNWTGNTVPAGATGYGTSSLSPGTSGTLEIDYWEPNTTATTKMQFYANQVTPSAGTHFEFLVPSSWMQTVAAGLPPGWTYGADDVAWIGVSDLGSQVVVNGASGATLTFERNADGTYSPTGENHNALTISNDRLQLSTASGLVYVFNADGSLRSASSTLDDTTPAKLQYGYSSVGSSLSDPVLLTTITDPVSTRQIDLIYGGQSGCPAGNNAPTAMLCRVDAWDGATTNFLYNTNQQLAGVTNPGNARTLFAYDSANRISAFRDVLASDYVSAGLTGSSGCSTSTSATTCQFDTTITYDSAGRVATIGRPAPSDGADRPTRTYTYQPSASDPGAGTTLVQVAGFNPAGVAGKIAAGYAWSQSYDNQSRLASRTDSTGLKTQVVWDSQNRPILELGNEGQQTSTVYDSNSNATDIYGPAPAACFKAGTTNPWPAGTGYSSPPAPVQGYLPVADPENASGCLTKVPHTQSFFDEGMPGLGIVYWPNANFAGAPQLHGTGAGIGSASASCRAWSPGSTTDSMCGKWSAGTAPGATDANGRWSMRLTGSIDVPTSGARQFVVSGAQPVALWIDGDLLGTHPEVSGVTSSYWSADLSSGRHQIRLDVVGDKEDGAEYSLSDRASVPSGQAVIPVAIDRTRPNYGLRTRSIDPDGKVATISYAASNGIQPHLRLETATTAGAGGTSPLTSTTTYEAPGAGFMRRTATKLPDGDQTTYAYWGASEGLPSTICGVPAGTNQGGMQKSTTGQAPTSGASGRRQYFVYDSSGRVTGTWVGPDSTSFASVPATGWSCTARDSRGRTSSQTWPAHGSAPSRTVTYTYSLFGNPLFSSVTDTASQSLSVSSAVDMLGRLVVYTDAFSQQSTIEYNLAGQSTKMNGPQGVVENAFDANSGVLKTLSVDGQWLAKSTYSGSTNRLIGVDYSNGSKATIGYDSNGRQTVQTYLKASDSSLITGDLLTLSPTGRTVSELQNINGSLQNANPAGPNSTSYTYDDAGRLVSAYLPGTRADYSYAQSPAALGCDQPDAGMNSNRTKVTITPTSGTATETKYCYNHADQLTQAVTGSDISLVGKAQAGQNLNALQPNSPLSVTYPTGTMAGDQALLAVAVTKGTNITVPSGYTTIGTYQTNIALGSNVTFQVMRKTLTSVETSVSVAFSKSDARTAIVAVYRGVDSANPIDAFSGASSGTAKATAVTAPSITTTAAGDRLVAFAGQKGSSTAVWTMPTAMTSLISSTGGGTVTSAAAESTLANAGASGAQTSTISVSGALATVLIALRPAITTVSSTYDDRGNQLSDGTTTYTYDASDRLASTNVGGVTTSYTYDPVGRILSRTTGGTAMYYGYGGYTDSPANTRTGTGIIQQQISLPGGVTKTIQAAGAYHPVGAQRILNTASGVGAPTGAVANHGSISLQVTGVGGVPAANVSAVAINLGSNSSTVLGNLIAYPEGGTQPSVSSLHFEAGQAASNLAIVPVGDNGKIRIYNSSTGSTQIVGDIQGYYESGTAVNEGAFEPVSAARIMDTRDGTGGVPATAVGAGGTVSLQVAGVADIPAATQVSAVVLHVMATGPTASGNITAYPDGTVRPATANLNYATGQSITNTVIVPLGSNGKVAFYNNSTGATDLVADIQGYYRTGPSDNTTGSYHPLPAARILNTQNGTGVAAGALAGSGSFALQVDGVGGVPASCVSAVAINLTGSSASAGGDLVAYADGSTNPGTSNLRYQSGWTVSNLAIVPVGTNGKIRIANQSAASVQVAGDVVGYHECSSGTANDDLWSYSDIHGHVTVTADDNAAPVGSIVNYDPWGSPLSNPVSVANAAVMKNFSSFGNQGKVTDPGTGITIMGARAYSASRGRFLTVDPVDGGCANSYVYGFGEPYSQPDLTGRKSCGRKILDLGVSATGWGLTIAAVVLAPETGGATIFLLAGAGTIISLTGAELTMSSCKEGDNLACLSAGISIGLGVTGIPAGLLAMDGPSLVATVIGLIQALAASIGFGADLKSGGPSTGRCIWNGVENAVGGLSTGFGLWG